MPGVPRFAHRAADPSWPPRRREVSTDDTSPSSAPPWNRRSPAPDPAGADVREASVAGPGRWLTPRASAGVLAYFHGCLHTRVIRTHARDRVAVAGDSPVRLSIAAMLRARTRAPQPAAWLSAVGGSHHGHSLPSWGERDLRPRSSAGRHGATPAARRPMVSPMLATLGSAAAGPDRGDDALGEEAIVLPPTPWLRVDVRLESSRRWARLPAPLRTVPRGSGRPPHGARFLDNHSRRRASGSLHRPDSDRAVSEPPSASTSPRGLEAWRPRWLAGHAPRCGRPDCGPPGRPRPARTPVAPAQQHSRGGPTGSCPGEQCLDPQTVVEGPRQAQNWMGSEAQVRHVVRPRRAGRPSRR